MHLVQSALVVPIKAFRAAKARLAGTIDPQRRAALARWMAGRVLDAADPLDRYVVCDDDEVAHFATANGAKVVWMPGAGLNGAVQAALTDLAGHGYDHAVVAHSDLPLANGLAGLARPGAVTLVPDRFDDGTNVLAVPLPSPIAVAYGPASFHHHLAAAIASNCSVHVRRDRRLALDVDRPADLAHPLLGSVTLP